MGHEVRFAVLDSRDVRNTFFNFGSVLVRFFEKKLIWFGTSLVRFKKIWCGSDIIVIYILM